MCMVQVTPLAAGLGPALAVLSTLLAATHSESAARALLSLYQQEQRHTHPHSLLSLTTYSNHSHPPGQQTVEARRCRGHSGDKRPAPAHITAATHALGPSHSVRDSL